jgi:UDP-glucuronate decarboxylase
VDDLIEAMVRLMNVEDGVPPSLSVHEPVNAGNAEEFTMRQLATEIGKAVGADIRIRCCPLPADDPQQRRPDLTRAKQLLDWSPKINFQDGIAKTVHYFASRVKRESPPLVQMAHTD